MVQYFGGFGRLNWALSSIVAPTAVTYGEEAGKVAWKCPSWHERSVGPLAPTGGQQGDPTEADLLELDVDALHIPDLVPWGSEGLILRGSVVVGCMSEVPSFIPSRALKYCSPEHPGIWKGHDTTQRLTSPVSFW